MNDEMNELRSSVRNLCREILDMEKPADDAKSWTAWYQMLDTKLCYLMNRRDRILNTLTSGYTKTVEDPFRPGDEWDRVKRSDR